MRTYEYLCFCPECNRITKHYHNAYFPETRELPEEPETYECQECGHHLDPDEATGGPE